LIELTLRYKDGTEFIGEVHSMPLVGKNAKIVGTQGITKGYSAFHDVSWI